MEDNTIKKIENRDSYGITYYEHGQPYLGSHRGMRFRLARNPMEDVALMPEEKKGDAVFEATIWPEPFCYEATPEEQKTTKTFPFNPEGKEQMIDWLNEQYEARYEEWEAVRAKH
ncbi:MAG: hypothetical protein NC300_09320 [Bacteroidales bacterium]|nr:hypothetical protein [Clostridium sp.]MCM1204330.1 hypothetical protein [Bacteroidales bacterium]